MGDRVVHGRGAGCRGVAPSSWRGRSGGWAPRCSPWSWSGRRARARWTSAAAAALVLLAAAGLVAASAAVGLQQRAESPLADAAASHRAADVIVEVVVGSTADPPAGVGRSGAGAVVPRRRPRRRRRRADRPPRCPSRPRSTCLRRPLSIGTRLAFTARVTPLPGAEQSGFRAAPRRRRADRGGAARVAGLGGRPAHGSRARPQADSAATGAHSCPGSPSATRAASARSSTRRCSASSLSHLTAVSGANCAIVTAAAFALAALCRLGRGARVVAALVALVRLRRARDARSRASSVPARWPSSCSWPSRWGARAAASRPSPSPSSDCSPSTRGSRATTGSRSPPRRPAGLLLLAGPLAGRLGRVMPAPLAVVLAVPLVRAARLPAHPRPARPGDRPLRRARQPAGGAGGSRRHGGRTPRMPRPAGAAIGRRGLPPGRVAARVVDRARGARRGRAPGRPAALASGCRRGAAARRLHRAGARPGPDRPATSPCARDRLGRCSRSASPCRSAPGSERRRVIGATRPGDWDVAACDVGQGDAVARQVRGRDGAHRHRPRTGGARPLPRACSGSTGSTCSCMTHWDADHAGGAAAVVGRVDTVIHGPLDGGRSDRVLGPLVRGGAEAVEVVAGHQGRLGDADWRVVWPQAPGRAGQRCQRRDRLWTLRRTARVFLGDLGEEAQERMLALGRARAGRPREGGAPRIGRPERRGSTTSSTPRSASSASAPTTGTGIRPIACSASSRDGRDHGGAHRPVGHGRRSPPTARAGSGSGRSGATSVPARRLERNGEVRWRHDQERRDPVRHGAAHPRVRRRRRSRSSPGTRCVRRRSCSSPAPRPCSPSARAACCATSSGPRTRRSR